jgi:hypothetical protein
MEVGSLFLVLPAYAAAAGGGGQFFWWNLVSDVRFSRSNGFPSFIKPHIHTAKLHIASSVSA